MKTTWYSEQEVTLALDCEFACIEELHDVVVHAEGRLAS